MSFQSNPIPMAHVLPEEGKQKHLFFAGKGGVGKTTMACAAALYASENGYKTLLVSTDPAAHLGNVLGKAVSSLPAQVIHSNLWVVRIHPKEAFDRYKQRILANVLERFGPGEALNVVQEELDSPCTEEVAVFQEFLGYLLDDTYSVIVFDTAPTGHTLRLLQLAWDYETELCQKTSFTTETSALDKEELCRMREGIRILQSKKETTMMFVTLAESTPIAEMERAIADLARVEVETQVILVNQMLPREAEGSGLFGPRRHRQQDYLKQLAERHRNQVVTECELLDDEVLGERALRHVATNAFANQPSVQ